MNTYKNRVPSPFRVTAKKSYGEPKKESKDTLRDEMRKLLGTYQFTATFERDTQTATTFEQIPGLVAFICTLKMGDKVIGLGRGATVINHQMSRFIVRSITYAYHASLIDAVMRATKLMDVFRPDAAGHPWSEKNSATLSPYKADDQESLDVATPKQVEYLRQLFKVNLEESERENMEAQLTEMTRQEASRMIDSFRR